METADAVKKLVQSLKEDEGYRSSWHANISMAFQDQANWDKRNWDKTELHETANKAADHFLKLLCS